MMADWSCSWAVTTPVISQLSIKKGEEKGAEIKRGVKGELTITLSIPTAQLSIMPIILPLHRRTTILKRPSKSVILTTTSPVMLVNPPLKVPNLVILALVELALLALLNDTVIEVDTSRKSTSDGRYERGEDEPLLQPLLLNPTGVVHSALLEVPQPELVSGVLAFQSAELKT
jgi:hypothetical protein